MTITNNNKDKNNSFILIYYYNVIILQITIFNMYYNIFIINLFFKFLLLLPQLMVSILNHDFFFINNT